MSTYWVVLQSHACVCPQVLLMGIALQSLASVFMIPACTFWLFVGSPDIAGMLLKLRSYGIFVGKFQEF
eukprot:UN08259